MTVPTICDGVFSATLRESVELTAAVERDAGQLADLHALGGADAVHLASALAIGLPDLVVAAWDRRLREGVLSARLRVAPP